MNIDNVLNFTKNTDALAQVMLVFQATMDLWGAEKTANSTRRDYHQSIQRYEKLHGPLVGRLSAESEAHAGVRKFTANTYEAHQTAKSKVYNAKRRLNTACRKLARTR